MSRTGYETGSVIYKELKLVVEITMCDTIMADFYLREGDILAAEVLFRQCLATLSHQKSNPSV